MPVTLRRNVEPGGVTTHSDMLHTRPAVLSRERAGKVNKAGQILIPIDDPARCLLCHPERLKGLPQIMLDCEDRVAYFENAAPYLPYDQKVIYMRHDDPAAQATGIHRCRPRWTDAYFLYYTTLCAIRLGAEFAQRPLPHTDLLRMVLGYNIGLMAGQSLPHLHAQYGWEVCLERENFSKTQMELYYEELRAEDLILFESKPTDAVQYKVIVPWTPQGQYHVAVHFPHTYEVHKMNDAEVRTFAFVGHRIKNHYLSMGIHNMNIVFHSSPQGREIEPVVADFIPRVNVPALYELMGRDVVDTPPSMIHTSMLPVGFRELATQVAGYDPDDEYKKAAISQLTERQLQDEYNKASGVNDHEQPQS